MTIYPRCLSQCAVCPYCLKTFISEAGSLATSVSAPECSCNACRRTRSAGSRSRRCQSLVEKLKREQAAALSSQQYPSESCPVCLEDFQRPPQDNRPSAPPLNPDMVSQGVVAWCARRTVSLSCGQQAIRTTTEPGLDEPHRAYKTAGFLVTVILDQLSAQGIHNCTLLASNLSCT